MADLLDKLWPAFVSEVTEQLDSVELLLAKSGAAESVDVNHLFRNFHTIKGNCSMIGFTSMETVAHRSEDILAAVRNGDIPMSDDVVDILLESISCLKKQFHSANETRENPVQDEQLVEKLINYVSEEHVQEDAVDESDEALQEKMQTLAASASVAVPVLVLGLDPAAKIEQVESAIAAMSEKAKQVGFKALAGAMNHFIDTLKSDIDDKQDHLLEQVAEIFDDISFICAEQGIDLGLDMGAKLCRSKLTPAYLEELAELTELLEGLKKTDPSEWEAEQFLLLVGIANKLSHYSSLFKLIELTNSWRYIKQLVIEVSRGYIVFNHDIIDQLLLIVESAKSDIAKTGGDKSFEEQCKKDRETLQNITASHNNSSDEIVQTKESIVSKTKLVMDSLIDLKMEVLTQINDAIDAGKLAVEIDIDFANEQLSEKVLMAVQNLGQLAHSRTMFHDIVNGVAQRTSFSFLILTEKSVEDINTILCIIDKQRETFEILGYEHLFSKDKEKHAAEETSAEQDASVQDIAVDSPDTSQSSAQVEDADEDAETENLVQETSSSMGSLKVEGTAIDSVISDVGELITNHNRLSHLITQDDFSLQLAQLKTLLSKDKNAQTEKTVHFFEQLFNQLTATNEVMQTSLNQLQNSVLDLRVVPIAYAFNRFHKFVRTIAKKLGKKVILDVMGEQVRVDKGMIDVLSEPLAHMIRNSIDHGIEAPELRKQSGKEEFGLIKLKAIQQSGMVVIEIIDDGAGLNRDKIYERCVSKGLLKAGENYTDDEIYNFIFEPGFSTSDEISETSGRGVGMDVVKSRISEVGGTVSVESTKGKGSKISLKLPVSAAIQSVILIENAGQVLAFPERHIVEVISINISQVQVIQNQSAFMLRDNIVPLYRLDELIKSRVSLIEADENDDFEVVIVANEQYMIGLVVDQALGRAEVLVRDVHETLRGMDGVSGAAILGDGKVVIILDCGGIFDMALNNAQNIIGMSAANEA